MTVAVDAGMWNGKRKYAVKRTKFPNGNGKGKVGRPSEYRDDMPERAFNLCLLGLDEEALAIAFGVSEVTLNAWKKAHPEFLRAIKDGGPDADANVARGTYQRAIGYSCPDVHVSSYEGKITITPITKHYPPDVAAQSMWLRCRQRDLWRESRGLEISGPDGGPIRILPAAADLKALTEEELKVIESAGIKLLTDGSNGSNGDSDSGAS